MLKVKIRGKDPGLSGDSILSRFSSSMSESPIVYQGKRAASDAAFVAKKLFKSTGKAAWIAGTTFRILVVPLIIEMDRYAQFTELEMQQASLLGALPLTGASTLIQGRRARVVAISILNGQQATTDDNLSARNLELFRGKKTNFTKKFSHCEGILKFILPLHNPYLYKMHSIRNLLSFQRPTLQIGGIRYLISCINNSGLPMNAVLGRITSTAQELAHYHSGVGFEDQKFQVKLQVLKT